MEDSPLSIAANIAGILTFIAAIFASVYVRVVSLRNGKLELEITRNSAENTAIGLNTMNRHHPSDLRERYTRQLGDEPDVLFMKGLKADLIATDTVIYIHCMHAMGFDETEPYVINLQSALSSLYDTGSTYITFPEAQVQVSDTSMQKLPNEGVLNLFERLIRVYLNKLVDVSQRLLSVGVSQNLMRWYRMRETVLETVRQRDVLRSRLLSHQVSMANS